MARFNSVCVCFVFVAAIVANGCGYEESIRAAETETSNPTNDGGQQNDVGVIPTNDAGQVADSGAPADVGSEDTGAVQECVENSDCFDKNEVVQCRSYQCLWGKCSYTHIRQGLTCGTNGHCWFGDCLVDACADHSDCRRNNDDDSCLNIACGANFQCFADPIREGMECGLGKGHCASGVCVKDTPDAGTDDAGTDAGADAGQGSQCVTDGECKDLGIQCLKAVCQSGNCVADFAPGSCNDGNPNTTNDQCYRNENGFGCAGTPITQADGGVDAGNDAEADAGVDAGDAGAADGGVDTGDDGGVDAGADAGNDAGAPACVTDGDCATANKCEIRNCVSGACQSTAVSCDDSDACTDDSCDPIEGCKHVGVSGCRSCISNSQCDDANKCTNEVCFAGTCVYAGVSCDDADPKTLDTCEPAVGCVYNQAPCVTDADCPSSNPASAGTCTAGTCSYHFVCPGAGEMPPTNAEYCEGYGNIPNAPPSDIVRKTDARWTTRADGTIGPGFQWLNGACSVVCYANGGVALTPLFCEGIYPEQTWWSLGDPQSVVCPFDHNFPHSVVIHTNTAGKPF